MLKYSIITCTYNSEKYVEKNIESVINQSFKNFEHIFIDGESTDKTINIINAYKKKHPENVFLYSQIPGGISKAMNEGIKRAKGEYIIHLHSDDSFFNEKVLENVDTFLNKENKQDWIYGKINVVEKDGKTSLGTFPNSQILQWSSNSFLGKKMLKYINFIPHQGVFIKKTVFDKFGYFNQNISSIMDFDMRLRIRNKTKWEFINIIISNYMIRDDAQSSAKKNLKENFKNRKYIVKKYTSKIEYIILIIFHQILLILNKTKR